MEYEDFLVDIRQPQSEGEYPVSVRSRDGGVGSSSFHDPFPVEGPGANTDLKEVGEELFLALFQGQTGRLYHTSLGGLRKPPNRGLRIKLQIDPTHPKLSRIAGYPWEALYDPDLRQFLALEHRTPIVRELGVPRPFRRSEMSPPLRILAVASNPLPLSQLDLDQECRNLKKACAGKPEIELKFLKHPCTPKALRDRLQSEAGGFHVLHFMGHGQFDPDDQGKILFENDDRRPYAVGAETLKNLIGEFVSLRLIFLNACNTASFGRPDPFTGLASALVLRGFPAVLAIGSAISDNTAIAFSSAFYQRLAKEQPLDAAVVDGRISASALSSSEWALPVLFTHRLEETPSEPGPEAVEQEGVKPPFRRRLFPTGAGLILAVTAVAALTVWEPGSNRDAEVSIEVPAEGAKVSVRAEVRGRARDPSRLHYLLVRDPEGNCWLQDSEPLTLDPAGRWRATVQLPGDPGDSYDIFAISSPSRLSLEAKADRDYCHLVTGGAPSVRHVYLDNGSP